MSASRLKPTPSWGKLRELIHTRHRAPKIRERFAMTASSLLRPRPLTLPLLGLSLTSCLLMPGCSTAMIKLKQVLPAPIVDKANKPDKPVEAPMPTAQADSPATVVAAANPLPWIAPPSLPLPVNPGPGSYALHPQSQKLAEQLALKYQIDPAWAVSVIAQAQASESVTRLIMPAANPGAKNWAAYRARFIDPVRLKAGVQFWRKNEATLQRAEATYGVPREIIAGIIGIETTYGRNTGSFRVLDVLATLSLDFPKGRSDRSAFFQDELGQFLRLCAEQQLDPLSVQGSFAGAIGLPQFMPSSIRRLAVDFDGDGKIDLRRSDADAIGSVAHFLAESGWRKGMATHYIVLPPADTASRDTLLGPDIKPTFSTQDFKGLGARLDATGQRHEGPLALVQLQNGGAEPTYIAGTENFYAITRYNQSSYYALAVIEMARTLGLAIKSDRD
jgi:membrane-bound lytic murein transglycosylase B